MNKLNFGCGSVIKDGFLNVDIQKGKGIDKSFDFDVFPYPFNDNAFDYILADNVLEHLIDPFKVLAELHRIGEKDSVIYIRVPYCRSLLTFNDITHRHHFNKRAMEQLILGSSYSHEKKTKFEIIDLHLKKSLFGKMIPFFLRTIFDMVFNEVYNQIEVNIRIIK